MINLKIAIQKTGRLNEDSIRLLKESGILINNGKNQLRVTSSNFPLEVLFLRNSDMLKYIADNDVDCGIVGENILKEETAIDKIGDNVKICTKLGFGKCRLSLAVPKEIKYNGLRYFNGKRIATSHRNILYDFLKKQKLNATIHDINGSVEVAPSLGLADGICDLVSSGNTLFTNGLQEVHTIMESQAVLVSRKKMPKELNLILEKLMFRINAVSQARKNKYIMLNAPNDRIDKISKILPGLNSPTIIPLKVKGWSALHSVINEEEFWMVIDQLKAAGAEGILVSPIEKMIN